MITEAMIKAIKEEIREAQRILAGYSECTEGWVPKHSLMAILGKLEGQVEHLHMEIEPPEARFVGKELLELAERRGIWP